MLRKFFQVLYRSDIQKTGASQKIPASRRRPHVAGIFAHRKRKFLNIRSLGWRCLKTKVCRIRVDGRKLRFSNTMTSCLRSRLATIRRRYIWTQIFLNTEEKVSVLKIPGYIWTVKYYWKTLPVVADIF